MRVLLAGAGGVGEAIAVLLGRRGFAEHVVVCDVRLDRARYVASRAAEGVDADAALLDASDQTAIVDLAKHHRCDILVNACDPRFVPSLFKGAFEAGIDYLDMAMSLSLPHPGRPHEQVGVTLGEMQFEMAPRWEEAGRLALVGMGVEPGLSDVFARYAADHLFSEIDEAGVRDGSDLVVEGYEFAPTFSIWTTIEECLNPPVIYEKDRGWYTTAPFSEPEVFDFPEGIGAVTCVNVEHEEVLLIPRWVDVKRATFKYGLGDEFIGVLRTLHKLALDRTDPVTVRGLQVSPRDVVAACLPDPATLGDKMTRPHLRRYLDYRLRQGWGTTAGVPLPRVRQRGDDAPARVPGSRLADRHRPGGGARVDGTGSLGGSRGARTGGVRCGAAARPPEGDGRALADARRGAGGRLLSDSCAGPRGT